MAVNYTKSGNELTISEVLYLKPKMMEDIARYILLSSTELSVDFALDTIELEGIPSDEVSQKYLKSHVNSDKIKETAIDLIKDHIKQLVDTVVNNINTSEVIANVTKILYKDDGSIDDIEVDFRVNFPTK